MRNAALVAGLALLSCVSPPDVTIEPGHEGAPGVERFLVCAPNVVLGLAAELQRGTKPVREEIERYLRDHGRAVEWIDLYESKQLWSAALARAKEAGAIDRTPAFFAEALSERYDFQVYVMPSILLHQVRVSDSSASWDGVRRRMRVLNAPRRSTGRHQDTLAEGIAYGGMSGPAAVTSLHVMIFTADGMRVFESRGGLEFVQEIEIRIHERRIELPLRGDLFSDRAALREGVEVAFSPYLPIPDER